MAGAVDYFLKIDGIEGESQDSKHKNEIDLESWNWGESQGGTFGSGGGGGAGKVVMQDFHFVMKINKACPKLMLACASGDHISKAVLVCRKAGKDQQEFYKVMLLEVLVSSYKEGGSAQGDIVPTTQITLNYGKISVEYKEQKPDGSLGGAINAGWDLKANSKI